MIIFDLDDTLIDTSGYVTPFQMKRALKYLVEAGMNVENEDVAYRELLSCNQKALKSKDALLGFIQKQTMDSSLAASALELLQAPLPSDFKIPTTPGALEILSFFRLSHKLALVTGGHPPFQLEKLKKAGLDRSIFSKIAIPEDSIKKPCYERLIEEFSISPDQVWVCGDRIEMDLMPAKELRCHAIHMRWGRGLAAKQWIGPSIHTLNELKRIIK